MLVAPADGDRRIFRSTKLRAVELRRLDYGAIEQDSRAHIGQGELAERHIRHGITDAEEYQLFTMGKLKKAYCAYRDNVQLWIAIFNVRRSPSPVKRDQRGGLTNKRDRMATFDHGPARHSSVRVRLSA